MEISSVSPANASTGKPLATLIEITFDEEIDSDSIVGGALIVTASASKLVIEGPSFENLAPSLPHNYLESDVFQGVVEGEISSEDNLTFVFSPSSLLLPNTTYKVIVGTKVLTKTIGPITPSEDNTGTGVITTKGPYEGDADTITVTVTSSGLLGTAEFSYRRDSTGLDSPSIVTDRLVEIEDGLFFVFKSGTYVEGDSFTLDVFEGTPLEDIYSFQFSTGASSYVEVSNDLPSVQLVEREVQGLRRIDNIPSVDSGTLALVSISPSDQASNVALGFETITLTFNKELDPDSLSDTLVSVLMENLPLDETEQMSVPLKMSKTVSGNKLILRFQG